MRRAIVPTYEEVQERIRHIAKQVCWKPDPALIGDYNKLNQAIVRWQCLLGTIIMFYGTRRPDELSNLRFGLIQWKPATSDREGGGKQLRIGVTAQKRRRKGLGRTYFIPHVPSLGKYNPIALYIGYTNFLVSLAAQSMRFADLTDKDGKIKNEIAPFFSTTSTSGHHFSKQPDAIQKQVNDLFRELLNSLPDVTYVNLRAASATWLESRGDDYHLAVAQGGWSTKLMAQTVYVPMSEQEQGSQMHVFANSYAGTAVGCKIATEILEAGYFSTQLHDNLEELKIFAEKTLNNFQFVKAAITLAAEKTPWPDVVFERAESVFREAGIEILVVSAAQAHSSLRLREAASVFRQLKEAAVVRDAEPDSHFKKAPRAALQLKNFAAMQDWHGPRALLCKDPAKMTAKNNKVPTADGAIKKHADAGPSAAPPPKASGGGAAASSSKKPASSFDELDMQELYDSFEPQEDSSDEDAEISEDELPDDANELNADESPIKFNSPSFNTSFSAHQASASGATGANAQ